MSAVCAALKSFVLSANGLNYEGSLDGLIVTRYYFTSVVIHVGLPIHLSNAGLQPS